MSAPASSTSMNHRPRPELRRYESILIGVDASDHSNRGVEDALRLAGIWNSGVTGAHVYAAKMHDRRFRQMEGGLPEKYREEAELEKQRDVHDQLITKGLSVITDSYLDRVETECRAKDVSYDRRSLEGKNYVQLAGEANSGRYDLLVLGALGLGAVQCSRIGTVCERVVRRSNIDTLVIKDAARSITDGPIVVAVDGSAESFGGLLTAYTLALAWSVPVHVISAYDPYYHYVAFNRIASVLSEEAGRVFRFKEQEQLHENIIDAGLAKIYEGHLQVAQSLADDLDVGISTRLLDGKPYEVIQQYLNEVQPGLLILGKIGIHADEELDIGGNAENLLRNVDCSVWLSHWKYNPPTDVLAETSTSWTREAEQKLEAIPEFARPMARLGILRYAQESGHTVITESIVAEATKNLCPVGMKNSAKAPDTILWSTSAELAVNRIPDPAQRNRIRLKAEKKARRAGSESVDMMHVEGFVRETDEFSNCVRVEHKDADRVVWTPEALARLARVPPGFVRRMAKLRIEEFVRSQGYKRVTETAIDEKYRQWGNGSDLQEQRLPWQPAASERLQRIPQLVRGMVMKEVEARAVEQGCDRVTVEVMDEAIHSWQQTMTFHSSSQP